LQGKSRVILFLPAVAYMSLIFFISSKSEPSQVVFIFLPDKLMHFLEFGFLGILLFPAFFLNGCSLKQAFFWTVSTGSMYAFIDEVHQYYVPFREMDVLDFLSDISGLIFFTCSVIFIYNLQRNSGKEQKHE